MLKKTPIIALVIAVLLTLMIMYIFEMPSRPFTTGQTITLYIISLCVALGIVLFFDPKARETTKKLSEINFYEEK